MWPLNYEDLNKFHISLGAGLLVAAFIFYLTVFNSTYDKYIDIQNKIDTMYQGNISAIPNERLSLITSQITFLQKSFDADYAIFWILFVLGLIYFFVGYFQFIMSEKAKPKSQDLPKPKKS
ncbi:MAG: hypothetical protein V1702_05455 [Candidatus Woesearchaeota archaeon]